MRHTEPLSRKSDTLTTRLWSHSLHGGCNNKSACIRVSPRHKETCYNLVMLDEREIRWTNTHRYLGVYLVSAKTFRCAIDNAKKSFNRS